MLFSHITLVYLFNFLWNESFGFGIRNQNEGKRKKKKWNKKMNENLPHDERESLRQFELLFENTPNIH